MITKARNGREDKPVARAAATFGPVLVGKKTL
jgi:hypothetical protein